MKRENGGLDLLKKLNARERRTLELERDRLQLDLPLEFQADYER